MAGQIDRIFCIELDEVTHHFQIIAVDNYPIEKKIQIKINGFAKEQDALIDKISKHFAKHITSVNLVIKYNQINNKEVILNSLHLLKLNIVANTHNCQKIIESLQFSYKGSSLHIKMHYATTKIQQESIIKAISYIAKGVGTECTYAIAKKKKIEVTSQASTKTAVNKNGYIFGRDTKAPKSEIADLNETSGKVTIIGYVSSIELRDLKDGFSQFLSIDITDFNSTISCGKYMRDAKKKQKQSAYAKGIKKEMYMQIQGDCIYDKYKKEQVIQISSIARLEDTKLVDDADEKRIELHLHTKMSTMDALVDVDALMDTAATYGHRAVGICDHGTVQAFPEAAIAAKKRGIKVLYGVEAYLLDDTETALYGKSNIAFTDTFVVFDVETTGLDSNRNRLTEIGAIKIKNMEIVDTFSTFVNPKQQIPRKIVELTGISNSMVKDAPDEDIALQKFMDFAKENVLVAHNANFDMGFITASATRCGMVVNNAYLDTIQIAKRLMPQKRSFKLDKLCRDFNIVLRAHHRAKDDAQATAHLLMEMFGMLKEKDIDSIDKIDTIKNMNIQGRNIYHAVIYARNKVGLKNLYKLISISNLNYIFRGKPNIPKTEIINLREGLIIGSACEAGELFRAIVEGKEDKELCQIAEFYDYLEVQPLGNNAFMIGGKYAKSVDDLIKYNKKVIQIGEMTKRLVVATGDVHFMKNRDSIFRAILMTSKDFDDADNQPPLFYRNTNEMLEEFYYLPKEKAKEIVIYSPNKICDMIDDIEPLPKERLYAPKMPNAKEQIVKMSYDTATKIYGEKLPEIVQKRLDKELNAITGYGYSVLYLIAQKLVKKSNEDGYIVGSRGSVGSSFVAALVGITEVDPLPPHYTCDNCNHADFDVDIKEYACGPDLPDKKCPKCKSKLVKRGFDIPFEVFLGFKGDKVPDIDLNFSGDNQAEAHKYTEVLFGKESVYRSGTISGVAKKTAYGYVMKYLEKKKIDATKAEINRLVDGCVGVRRTTGQHPGGIIVVPHEYDIYDFTPIQYPADDKKSNIITTHFTFNSLHDRLVKLDILGHDDPTMLKMLKEMTGVEPLKIPLDDKGTMALFSSTKSLGVTEDDILAKMGTYGIPEFGTGFVRGMLKDTMPTTMAELVRISGLSHGTDVWLGNAQDLIKSKTATLLEAICTRDDIMNALIAWNIEAKMSFDIMESVRKGKGLTDDMEEAMVDKNVPIWFINSCKLIKYMFPKAHAVAYVIMAFRIAYYKVNYPLEYYCAYFSIRGEDFDAQSMICTIDEAKIQVKKLRSMGNDISTKEKGQLIVLEVVLEMLVRGFEFAPMDLYKSHAKNFIIVDGKMLSPLNRLPGLGTKAAIAIVKERQKEPFRTIEDLRIKTGVNKAVIEVLKDVGCLDDIPERSQVSFFDE